MDKIQELLRRIRQNNHAMNCVGETQRILSESHGKLFNEYREISRELCDFVKSRGQTRVVVQCSDGGYAVIDTYSQTIEFISGM